jgi:hypothetical protein
VISALRTGVVTSIAFRWLEHRGLADMALPDIGEALLIARPARRLPYSRAHIDLDQSCLESFH